MKAHELAKLLLKMPNIDVGYSHMDNSAHEVAGWCNSVELLKKKDIDTTGFSELDFAMYNDLSAQTVVIRG